MEDLVREIQHLKKARQALLLAHYYESGEIQDIADAIGDSLQLAQIGQKSEAPVVLLAGVVFMAESVKILSPEKTVLAPDLEAGCSLVQQSPFAKYKAWREQHPHAICVTYVNCSAEVKSISDVICTSSNAEKIINAIPADREILFGPDHNLGAYLQKKIGRPLILWPGACQVHVLFSEKKLFDLKKDHPDAVVLAHPECVEPVLRYADVIGSTSRLLDEVVKNPARKFIVATEDGILHQMRRARPDVELIQAPVEGTCGCNQCPFMKLNTLEKIRNSLRDLRPQIQLDPVLMAKARIALKRMMDITEGRPVTWPSRFVAEASFGSAELTL